MVRRLADNFVRVNASVRILRPEIDLVVTTLKTWRNEYYCPDCGELIHYRKEEVTGSADVSVE